MTLKYVWNGFAQNDTGDVLGGATVTVRDQDTNALSTLYTDKDGGTESDNPFLVGDSGQIAFYASSGRYKITAVKDSDTVTFENVVIGVPDDALQTVDTLAELTAQSYGAGSQVDTKGYYAAGDGGRASYYIKTAAQASSDGDVIDGYINHTIANGNVAILQIAGDGLDIRQSGAFIESSDNADNIHACNDHGIVEIVVPDGVFIHGPLDFSNRVILEGSGTLKLKDGSNANQIRFRTGRSACYVDLDGNRANQSGSTGTVNGVFAQGIDGVSFRAEARNHLHSAFTTKDCGDVFLSGRIIDSGYFPYLIEASTKNIYGIVVRRLHVDFDTYTAPTGTLSTIKGDETLTYKAHNIQCDGIYQKGSPTTTANFELRHVVDAQVSNVIADGSKLPLTFSGQNNNLQLSNLNGKGESATILLELMGSTIKASNVILSGTGTTTSTKGVSLNPYIDGPAQDYSDVELTDVSISGAFRALQLEADGTHGYNNIRVKGGKWTVSERACVLQYCAGVKVSDVDILGATFVAQLNNANDVHFANCDVNSIAEFFRITTSSGYSYDSITASGNVCRSINRVNMFTSIGTDGYGTNCEGYGNIGVGTDYIDVGNNIIQLRKLTGNPEGNIVAGVGSTALRSDGSTSTTFYVKEAGTGNTGWVAK